MISGSVNDWCLFYSVEELPSAIMFGYQPQMKIGISIAQCIRKTHSCKYIIAFGYPGNGKSYYPLALANNLKEKVKNPFSLAIIRCDLLQFEYDEYNDLILALDECINELLQHQPIILCFDEIDSLFPHVNLVDLEKGAVSSWMRLQIRYKKIFENKEVMLIGITNNPRLIEPSVCREFKVSLYFEPTPLCVTEKLVESRLPISNVGESYRNNLKKYHLQPMGAQVTSACAEVLMDFGDLSQRNIKDIVHALKANILPPSPKDLKDYERFNKELITLYTRNTVPYYFQIYEEARGD